MENKLPHTVKLIGLSENEQKILSTIFMLSKTRPVSFCPVGEDKNSKPEIMIVNFDDAAAVHKWQTLCIQNTEYSSIPVIRVTRTRFKDTGNYYAHRPFIATMMYLVMMMCLNRLYLRNRRLQLRIGKLIWCDSYPIKPAKSDIFKETMMRYIQ